MPRWNLLVIIAYFLYFASFLTGIPAPRTPDRSGYENEALGGVRVEESGESRGATDGAGGESAGAGWTWRAGLIERALVQNEVQRRFGDPLLESDSRPEGLFRQIERTYTADLTRLFVTVFWCALIALLLPALYKRHWFYMPMSFYIFLFSALAILLELTTARQTEILLGPSAAYGQARAVIEILLFFLGGAATLERLLPPRADRESLDNRFLEHLLLAPRGAGERTRGALRTLMHLLVIAGAAAAIANLTLLPIYKLQLMAPGFFAALIAAGLLALAVFYVRAYARVGRAQEAQAGYGTAIAFLGYRFLKNSLFVFSVICLIALAGIAIVALILNNIELLQGVGITPPPDRL